MRLKATPARRARSASSGDLGAGATNAVTGLTDALMDPIPIVCLTGQVPTHLIGNDAFRRPIPPGSRGPAQAQLPRESADDLSRILHEAFYVARAGRPGPVVVDLPKDTLQNKELHPREAVFTVHARNGNLN